MSLNPGYSPKDFFPTRERNIYWNPPFLGAVISGKRFSKIGEGIRLNNDVPPTYKDRFFWVRNMIDGFNHNMSKTFNPAWMVCVDESMVVFYNKYAPGWIAVKRKPHPLGNEYHTTACCESKIIFCIELVEGKSAPKLGPHREAEFEHEFDSKIAALVVRMTRPIWGSGRAVIMDSGFGYVASMVQLKAKGLFATTVIKKKRFWPKYTKAIDAVNEMDGKEVGTMKVRIGSYISGEGQESITLVALADSLFTSLMLTNWSTTRRGGRPKVRRVGGELVTFEYGEVQNHYYQGRHAVDDNNNNRQGCLSFEEVFQLKDWAMRQFGFVIALCQTNAFLAFNCFNVNKHSQDQPLGKAQFTRMLAKELIENKLWVSQKEKESQEDEATNGSRRTRRVEDHELMKIPSYRGKWNGRCFRKVKDSYQKYKCSSQGCIKRVRTYCKCDKVLILCMECYAIHKNECMADDDQAPLALRPRSGARRTVPV